MKKSLFARIMVLGLALVLVTGCASLRGVTSVDPQNGSQVFQAQAVKLPSGIASLKELDQLTGVVIPLNLNWLSDALIKGVSVGGKQEVILRDVWPALVIAPDGQVTETSALLSQGMDQLYILVPNMSEAQVKKSHVYIVSANHTAVMTLRGAIIGGPIGLREEVDVVRLKSGDRGYVTQFITQHPSQPGDDELHDYSPRTEAGGMLVEYFGRRFPELAAFAGGNYLVNAKTDKLVGATPQVTLMDKWISTNHLFITPSIGTPPGAGAFLLQLVVSMAYASQVPAFSGFEGSFSGQEITNFLAQMAKRNINNCNNGERR